MTHTETELWDMTSDEMYRDEDGWDLEDKTPDPGVTVEEAIESEMRSPVDDGGDYTESEMYNEGPEEFVEPGPVMDEAPW